MEGIRADVTLVVVPLPNMHRALCSIPRTADETSNLREEINGGINVTVYERMLAGPMLMLTENKGACEHNPKTKC